MTNYRSAHLQTLREAVGLSTQEAADYFGVTARTWQYWESPAEDAEIKTDVFQGLRTLLELSAKNARGTIAALDAREEGDATDQPVTITRYRNQAALNRAHPNFPGGLSVHSRCVANMVVFLTTLGLDVEVLWDDDPLAHINYNG